MQNATLIYPNCRNAFYFIKFLLNTLVPASVQKWKYLGLPSSSIEKDEIEMFKKDILERRRKRDEEKNKNRKPKPSSPGHPKAPDARMTGYFYQPPSYPWVGVFNLKIHYLSTLVNIIDTPWTSFINFLYLEYKFLICARKFARYGKTSHILDKQKRSLCSIFRGLPEKTKNYFNPIKTEQVRPKTLKTHFAPL